MRLFFTFIFVVTITLSACGERTNAKFENLTPEQKQAFINKEKRTYIHSLVCENFGDEIFRYKKDKANKEFSHLHKYFYDYPFHFNILKANSLYELRKRQVQLMFEARGIYGFDTEFKDWNPPLMSELNCDERLSEWINLRDEWEELRKVLPIEMYKQFTIWDRVNFWLDDVTDWLSKMFYATLAFLIVAGVTIFSAKLHYELFIARNRDSLYPLLIATPLSAMYFQTHLKKILDPSFTFWWRVLIASVVLSLTFSCISFFLKKVVFKKTSDNSNSSRDEKLDTQITTNLHELLTKAITSCDRSRINNLLSNSTEALNFFDSNGLTPFHFLLKKGRLLNESDLHIARLMISYGADVTLPTKDEREWTPLHMLASIGKDTNEYHGKIANLLLENGADPDSTTPLGYTPLHFIAMNGNLESLGVLQQLINFNANPYCTTSDGVTNWRILWQHGEEIFETLHAYEKRYI